MACMADLGKSLLESVMDAKIPSGLKKKLKKHLEEKSIEGSKYGETTSC